MENIKTALIGFMVLAIIIGTAYSINLKVLVALGLIVVGMIGVISLIFLAFIVGEVFLNMWRKIKERD